MFCGPSFIVSTMQEETTPIFKRLWYDWTQQQPGIEPNNPLGQCWVPPIVAFYDQQGLLRAYLLRGGSIRSPHPGSWKGQQDRVRRDAPSQPTGDSGQDVSISIKLKAFRIKHILHLIFRESNAKWTFFAIYYVGFHLRKWNPAFASNLIPHSSEIEPFYSQVWKKKMAE